MLRLLATHDYEERVFEIPESEGKLGSAPENDLVLRVPGISRRHALVRRCQGGVVLLDLGSKNGLIVAGLRVRRALLTPGLRVQIGAAWLEVEEVSSSRAELMFLLRESSEEAAQPAPPTAIVEPGGDLESRSPVDAALLLAYHIAQVGVGLPGKRTDLLARIKAILGAEAFASFERTRRGRFRILESAGEFLVNETKLLASLVAGARPSAREQVVLTRSERILLAGRDAWFVGAKFREESLIHEGWRKDFLRFLAHQFFMPVRSLDDLSSAEASRVLALVRGNKRRTALLLGVSPGTLYKLLSHRSAPKR
ncbi:MAG TPA: FHA domain-containing protein [Thermoanaerobaculia bacterium]|jgi:pSer/pThr/pTyr-binding forkhead associated (FHA) protein|nr:FHA domain-containing protein [Thermoanaerobaculia bacterium]